MSEPLVQEEIVRYRRRCRRRCHHAKRSVVRASIREWQSKDCDQDDPFEARLSDAWRAKFDMYDPGAKRAIEYIFGNPLKELLAEEQPQLHIRALRIEYVDRGVKGLVRSFPDALARVFPKLQFLMWQQNYSQGDGEDDENQGIGGFFQHPFVRNIAHVFVDDYQSTWFVDAALLDRRNVPGRTGSRCVMMRGTGEDAYSGRTIVQIDRLPN